VFFTSFTLVPVSTMQKPLVDLSPSKGQEDTRVDVQKEEHSAEKIRSKSDDGGVIKNEKI
jgi:hypothetical protein